MLTPRRRSRFRFCPSYDFESSAFSRARPPLRSTRHRIHVAFQDVLPFSISIVQLKSTAVEIRQVRVPSKNSVLDDLAICT